MDPQLSWSWAWALEIKGPATLRVSTTDLMEKAAVTALGAFYKKAIKSSDVRIVDGLPNLFYGIRRRDQFQMVVSNADGDIDPTADWRGAPYTLWLYDRNLGTTTEDSVGIVTDAQFANGQVTFAFGGDESIYQVELPAATITPAVSSPFETSDSPGDPIPVIFGSSVPVQPPNIAADLGGDGELTALDYAVGFGTDLRVVDAFGDWDFDRTGLERFGTWTTAPGSPAYLATELDPTWKATRFAVTGNQSARYQTGQPFRCKTTAGGGAYRYSVVKAYHAFTDIPDQVEIYDALFDSGLSDVELSGDYAIVRDVYANVTAGLLPEPATGVGLTVFRLFGQEDTAILLLADNPTYPSGSGGTLPATIIQHVIVNAVWGCSSRVQYAVDGTSFTNAAVAQSLAGLGGLIQGALAHDGKQLPAEQWLDWLCQIGRSRLYQNDRDQWAISTDVETLSVQHFHFGPGLESGVRIKRVVSYGRAPLDRATRNVILHWMPHGRVRARARSVEPQAYARFSTKAVSGVGVDRHYFNPLIRSEEAAEKTLQYLGEMLKGADETLVFTAGPEARDRLPGDVITALSTVDGFSGDWKVWEVSKSLTDVQLSCIRFNPDAYATPSGITHSDEPSDTPNTRTPPGPGPNLLLNPDLAPPLYTGQYLASLAGGGRYVAFTEPGAATVVGLDVTLPPVRMPHGWNIARSYGGLPEDGGGILSEFSVDESQAVRARTKSGHYVRMVWASVSDTAPDSDAQSNDGIFADQIAVGAVDHFISFYGDAPDGWYVVVYEDTSPVTHSLPTLIRDTTDTDGNGWERFYCRWRPKSATARAIIGICVSKPGTYNVSSVQVEPVTGAARRPSDWRRHIATPASLTRSAIVTLNGATTYDAPLIKAGDYVLGATLRVVGEITLGTATNFALGSTKDPEVWARDLTDLLALTTSDNFKDGFTPFFSAIDQDVLLSFLQDLAGTPPSKAPGTATDGAVSIVLEYARSAPTPGT